MSPNSSNQKEVVSKNIVKVNQEKIEVDLDDEFFIAVCTTDSIILHSYITVGVKLKNINNQDEYRLLASIGKYADPEDLIRKAIFSKAPGFLTNEYVAHGRSVRNENKYKDPEQTEARYSAYAIDYAQYCRFINLLSSINPKIAFYRPNIQNNTDTKITLRYGAGQQKDLRRSMVRTKRNTTYLNLSNTCRNSALDIIDYVAKPVLSDTVSTLFYKDLKLSTTFSRGATNHLYVLPKSLDDKQAKNMHPIILNTFARIYIRLDDMIQKSPNSSQTKVKFAKLKELYNHLLTCNKTDLPAFQKEIDAFLKIQNNQKILYGKRDPTLFSKLFKLNTSTENMFIDINKKIRKQLDVGKNIKEQNFVHTQSRNF